MNDVLFDLQSDKQKFDWNQDCISDSGVIKKAFIFGSNSSGKSYFLQAMTQTDCYAPNSTFKYVFELNGQEKVYEFSKDSNNEHVSQNLPMMFYVDMDQMPKKEDALIEHFILKNKWEQKLENFLHVYILSPIKAHLIFLLQISHIDQKIHIELTNKGFCVQTYFWILSINSGRLSF